MVEANKKGRAAPRHQHNTARGRRSSFHSRVTRLLTQGNLLSAAKGFVLNQRSHFHSAGAQQMLGGSPREDFSSSNRKNPTAASQLHLRSEVAPWDTRQCHHQAQKAQPKV